ncbi:cell division protein FtsZ [Kordiimonas pumila]|uniref:Cell division protein FtsZ n=1 Tax=Kordiimonas pumila TaxID=2161677 RepID=A0ABV7D8S3_9PROT|nr:cell division protein FtsZ [Kordiimonas pumila]
MSIEFGNTELTELTPRIAVIGVGGAGCNAVNNMIAAQLQGVDFVVANTDAQSLTASTANNRIQLGVQITQGLGAGAQPKIGEAAAEEALETIDTILDGCHMAFITAGMGGGTGTGAAPVIARRARERGILTVGVVTKPFQFEGGRRMKIAEAGIKELSQHVDTLIIIPNQNLFRVANERTTFADAFNMADEVLHSGVRGITDLMVMPGLINLDFADVRTVMSEMGKAMMGTGEAEGETRAQDAAAAAISNPLLEEASLKGAKGVIINVTGGMDMTLYEVDEAVNMVREQVDQDALIVFGSAFNPDLEGKLRVSVVATGIEGGIGGIDIPAPERKPIVVETREEPAQIEKTEPEVTAHDISESAEAGEPQSVLDAIASAVSYSDEQSVVEEASEAENVEIDEVPASVEAEERPVVRSFFPEEADLEDKAVASVSETFVAEAPLMPKASVEQPLGSVTSSSIVDAYASDEAVEEDQVPYEEHQEEQPQQKRSLFQVMTAGLRSSEATAPVEKPLASNDGVTTAQPSTPSLGGVSADDRPAPKPSTDQLEIPSFLRRQQN